MTRKYYAKQSPRGFANEVNYYGFSSRKERDEFVRDHKDDGDVNAAYTGARACTSKDVRGQYVQECR